MGAWGLNCSICSSLGHQQYVSHSQNQEPVPCSGPGSPPALLLCRFRNHLPRNINTGRSWKTKDLVLRSLLSMFSNFTHGDNRTILRLGITFMDLWGQSQMISTSFLLPLVSLLWKVEMCWLNEASRRHFVKPVKNFKNAFSLPVVNVHYKCALVI